MEALNEQLPFQPNQIALFNKISLLTRELLEIPEYRDWKERQIYNTLSHEHPGVESEDSLGEYQFDKNTKKRVDLMLQFFELQRICQSLAECEYYFRRYPFNHLPVTKHQHLSNICEMYFSRFYQFRERLKTYIKYAERLTHPRRMNGGDIIKSFDRKFDWELRQRNTSHHHLSYNDIAIQKISLFELLGFDPEERTLFQRERARAYRKNVQEWVKRVRIRYNQLDDILEEIARFTVAERLLED